MLDKRWRDAPIAPDLSGQDAAKILSFFGMIWVGGLTLMLTLAKLEAGHELLPWAQLLVNGPFGWPLIGVLGLITLTCIVTLLWPSKR